MPSSLGSGGGDIGDTSFAFVREPPDANSVTSWPASARPSASSETTSSIPPYPVGGTGNQTGAITAMRIVREANPLRAAATVFGMPQPWTTSASATVGGAGGIVTLVEGSSFCISSRAGEIDPDHPQGLFFRDTRFVSELRLTLNGTMPEPLAATTTDPFSAVFVLRGHPSSGRADSHLVLVRRRYIGRGMREDIEIENYGEEAAFCSVELLDRRRLRRPVRGQGRARPQAGQARRSTTTTPGRITFTYERSTFTRATHVDFTGEPRISGSHVHYEVIVPPRGSWHACMQVTPVIGDLEITPRHLCGQPVERSTPVERLEEWTRRLPVVTTDDDQFRALLERSTRDVAGLRIFDPEFPDRAVVAAGAPWFMTLFGRDSLITSWMTMLVDPDLALGTLQTLARFQGEKVDPRTEEEPGRILHEMRFGETASLALGGGRIYYGTVDATPLFVMLVGELSRWGNRREEVDALLPAADRALDWIFEYGDKDGDGYVEYQRTTDHGLQNQGWKDSWDSMRFADGTLAAHADRAVRSAGLRVRRARRAFALRDRSRRSRSRDQAARAGHRAEAPLQRGLLGRDRRRRLLRARPRPRQAQDRRPRLQHGPLPLDGHRRRGEGAARRARVALRADVLAAGASARCRRTRSVTTRSRTTAVVCGRTTTRSARPGSCGTASPTKPTR